MSPRAVAARISRAKNEMQTPGEYAAAATDFTEERTAKIYSLYQERLRASHAVDFDDLLMLTVRLFRDHAARPGATTRTAGGMSWWTSTRTPTTRSTRSSTS